MKIKISILFIGLIIMPLARLVAQIAIPQDYFSSPLHIGLAITGGFSEIRSGHFHSGTDLQVQQREGLPVYAVADGVVSRIKVSPVGFGNALYIDHPNGFTSVYAHLQKYNDTIAEYVHDNQYKLKSFEVDLFPKNKKEFIFIRKGQLIGYAGNSGSSGGAHLHFELRNTKTEHIINPLLFGLPFSDNYPPVIDFIKMYPESKNSSIGSSQEETRFNLKKAGNREYRLALKDTIPAWGKISFGAQAFDYNQSPNNRNGFYSMKMYSDSSRFFSLVCDSFAFDESRYVSATIDYPANYNYGSTIIKSKKLPGNRLSFFKTDKNNGILDLTDEKVHEIVIAVADVDGNTVNLTFWIKSQKLVPATLLPETSVPDSTLVYRYDRANKFENKDIKVELPAFCLYDDLAFSYKKTPGNKSMFSEIHFLQNAEVPLQSKIKVAIKATDLPPQLRSKALLVRVDRDGKKSAAGGGYENGYVSANTNLFDGYAIVVDTISPVIKPLAENSRSKSVLKFIVSDNFSGIREYRGEVNGKWALVEWDPKNKLMLYRFDQVAVEGKNTFTLFLEDEKGNKVKYSTTFDK